MWRCIYTVCFDWFFVAHSCLSSVSLTVALFFYKFEVNPIAVNSKYCNVFTENKRTVSVISTADFGKVCLICH